MRWRRTNDTGTDTCVLQPTSTGRRLVGHAGFVHAGRRYELDYRVDVDPAFRTLRARVASRGGGRKVTRRIDAKAGEWRLDGRRVPSVDGCVDVDLAFTPATNLLAIRRLRLEVGDKASVRAAWLRFPQFDLTSLDQSYHRTAPRIYAYRSGRFRARLEVDRLGFVRRYGDLWTVDDLVRRRRGP